MEQAAPLETTTAPATDASVKAQIDQQMTASLAPFVDVNVLPAAPATTAAGGEAGTQPAGEATTTTDPFGIFKEKFGYASPEDAVQEIEALRAFRAAPPAAELKFENDRSRHIAEALQKDDVRPLYDFLHQQIQIDRLTAGELTDDMATEIVKYGMQLKYKDLSAAEINYKFNKQFGLPPKPVQQVAEDADDYNARVSAWQAQIDDRRMELTIEAKTIRPDLAAAKTKLVIPTIARPQEQEFQDWQKTNQENDALAAETTAAYKAFTPTSLETKLNFKDEPNKIDFHFTHEPDPQSFAKTIDMCSDIDKFWGAFIGPDGKPDRQGFAKALYYGMNMPKILLDAMNQTKNATIKAMLPDNSTGGIVRQLPAGQEQQSELDAFMRASLKGHGGF